MISATFLLLVLYIILFRSFFVKNIIILLLMARMVSGINGPFQLLVCFGCAAFSEIISWHFLIIRFLLQLCSDVTCCYFFAPLDYNFFWYVVLFFNLLLICPFLLKCVSCNIEDLFGCHCAQPSC